MFFSDSCSFRNYKEGINKKRLDKIAKIKESIFFEKMDSLILAVGEGIEPPRSS
jgi:hypothetical protein